MHVLIGDFNTEPTAKRVRAVGPNTRSASRSKGTTESTVGTSLGGSLYDRAVLTNDNVNGRQLKLKNDTGTRGKVLGSRLELDDPDHAQEALVA